MQESVFRRILTSNITISMVMMVGLGAAVLYLDFGKAKPPAIAADGDVSANEALQLIDQHNDMTPLVANAVAQAKHRAYLREQAIKKKAREKAAWYKKHKAEIEAKLAAERLAKMPNPSSAQNQEVGRRLNAAKGWAACWPSLLTIWNHESGWNERADNPWSDAYGIPQALPGSKMASSGPNWQYNATTQILWGLSYIGARYGDPCKAWAYWQSHHWY